MPPRLGLKAFAGAVAQVKKIIRRDFRPIFGVRVRVDLTGIDDKTEDIAFSLELVLHRNHYPTDFPFTANETGPMFTSIREGNNRPMVPKLEFLNARSATLTEPVKVLQSNRTGTFFFIYVYDIVLQQTLLLHNYPYDRQVLKLQFQSHSGKFQKWFQPLDDTPVNITNDASWSASEMVVSYKKLDWNIQWVTATNVRIDMSDLFELNIGVSRNPFYYLYNYVLVIFAVVQANGSTYAITRMDYANRITVTTTLLLTLVAFKLVMADNVPRIPYQTYLDFYNIIAIVALAVWVVENFMVSARIYPDKDDPEPEFLDFAFALGWNAVWFTFHVIIVIGTIYGWFQNKWEAVEDKEKKMVVNYKQHFTNLSGQGALNVAAGSFHRGSSVRHMKLTPPAGVEQPKAAAALPGTSAGSPTGSKAMQLDP